MVKEIDVEKIVETIRKKSEITNISSIYNKIKIESQNVECDVPPMGKALNLFADKRVKQILEYLRPRCEMKYYRDIENKNFIKKFIKRAIRKTLKFCIYPMAMEQSVFNHRLVEIIEQQQIQIRELQNEIEKRNK